MIDALDSLKPYAHWLLRVSFASVFLYHGIDKVMEFGGFAERSSLPTVVAALVTFAEVAGGAGIIVGAFTTELITRLAGVAIVPVMFGAMFMERWGQWNFTPAEGFGGMESTLV